MNCDEDEQQTVSDSQHDNHQQLHQQDEEEDDEEEDLIYFCQVCNKQFKSVNSFDNHQKSKKHLSKVQQYSSNIGDDDDDNSNS